MLLLLLRAADSISENIESAADYYCISEGRYGGGSQRGDSIAEKMPQKELLRSLLSFFYCKLLFSGVADRLILRRH